MIQNDIDKGYAALSAGDGEAAVSLFTKAIQSRSLGDVELASVLINRGLAFQTRTQYQKAVDDYSAALRLVKLPAASRAATLYNRGLAYQKLARPQLAIDDFTSALFINSSLGHAYYSRANTLREIGQYLFALSDYEKAQRYGFPETHLPLYGRAVTYALLGRQQNAEQLLRDALAAKPDFPAARKKLDELTQPQAAGSLYGRIADRIDAIVATSVPPIAADRLVRSSAAKEPALPPRQLLEAAGQVAFSTVELPGHRSLSLAEIPDAMAPAFVISERLVFKKDQARVAAGEAPESVTIEPVSAPVEFTTDVPPPPEPSGWLVQINSQRNEDAAWSAWSAIQNRHAEILSAHSAVVQKADLGSEGVVFRLRVKNLTSRDDAVS
ncbi:MAG: tetratricopeptide repeat protein, partial [Pseudomonadota bacterium]|nr:tetratricopeptide repeat protein [Pseudomonadota bacterium]